MSSKTKTKTKTTLIIDADDTLWENNVHFEKATDRFLELVQERAARDGDGRGDGRGEDLRAHARALLTRWERKNIPVHGYGTRGFTRSMMDTLEELTGAPTSAADRECILVLGDRVRNMPIEYLPGVRDTLPILRERHRLILFTKGDFNEQRDKVERGGASVYFHHVEITGEKDEGDYHRLVDGYGLSREETWMVGNSPRSDVNPALDAGLGAVYIPHPNTWSLEHEEVRARPGGRLKVLKRFAELLDHFFPS
jgi:putative hydrolase of the HAD superfamily